MEFAEFEPVYEAILDEFGYGRTGDERARDVLARLYADSVEASPQRATADTLNSVTVTGDRVAVVGGAPTLLDDLDTVTEADSVVAASNAARTLRERGFDIDCMVTDLDKTPETARELTEEETPVVVHAHGDNIELLERHFPTFDCEWVVPTTQARPAGAVQNFGGFTDGDRAAFLADELGAETLCFAGWDLDDESVSPEKQRKLNWAGRLLYWLEQRRDEQFDLLDGSRDNLSLP